jgi:hypothetical protein
MCCARQKKYQKCVVVCFRMFLNSIEDGRLCVFGARLTSLYTMRLTLSASKNQKLFVILNTLDVCQRSVLEDLCFMLSNWSWRTGLDLYPSRLIPILVITSVVIVASKLENRKQDIRSVITVIPFILFQIFLFPQRIYQLRLECSMLNVAVPSRRSGLAEYIGLHRRRKSERTKGDKIHFEHLKFQG